MKTYIYHIATKYQVHMRLLVLPFASLFIQNYAMAQDTLKFRSGNLTVGKVLEITSTTVKYQKAENINGPIYSDLKNDIEYVKFLNGSIERFEIQKEQDIPVIKLPPPAAYVANNPKLIKFGSRYQMGNNLIGEREMLDFLLSVNNRKITNYVIEAKQQKKGQYIGFAAIPFGIAALVCLANSQAYSYGPNAQQQDQYTQGAAGLAVLGVACIATSITLKVKRTKNTNAALKLYQDDY